MAKAFWYHAQVGEISPNLVTLADSVPLLIRVHIGGLFHFYRVQCDQILFSDYFGYFEKHQFFCKKCHGYFLATFRKTLGFFLIQHLVTLIGYLHANHTCSSLTLGRRHCRPLFLIFSTFLYFK